MAGWIAVVKGFAPLLALGAWLLAFRLLVLSFLTYFLVMATDAIKLAEVEESYSSYRMSFAALGISIFVVAVVSSTVLTKLRWNDLFPKEAWARRWGTGMFEGAATALAIFAGLYFSGTYHYMGFLVHFEEGPWAWVLIAFRIGVLFLFTYSEEFWFRGVALPRAASSFRPAYAILGVALLTTLLRRVFFDLGISHLISLFLLSVLLCLRAMRRGDWLDGAGRWFGLLLAWHPLLGLPVLGADFPGTFLMRYGETTAEESSRWVSLTTGGPSGPLSSVLLLALLLAACARELSDREFRKRILDVRVRA